MFPNLFYHCTQLIFYLLGPVFTSYLMMHFLWISKQWNHSPDKDALKEKRFSITGRSNFLLWDFDIQDLTYFHHVNQGSQTQIYQRAAFERKNDPQATDCRKNYVRPNDWCLFKMEFLVSSKAVFLNLFLIRGTLSWYSTFWRHP